MSRPSNVGIVAIDCYFPRGYVAQADLEKSDGVSQGKYTIGLGQTNMSFSSDREDINSVCLSVVQRLLDQHGILPTDIGRVEVGTETLVDKSKSTKTVLMDLFKAYVQLGTLHFLEISALRGTCCPAPPPSSSASLAARMTV